MTDIKLYFILITPQVLHSQRLREKPLEPWVISHKDGTIQSGHCTCMAGLGETCTHIAALLFAIDSMVQVRESKTVTEEKAYWLLPSSLKTVEYKEVREMDFSSSTAMKKKLDIAIQSSSNPVMTDSSFIQVSQPQSSGSSSSTSSLSSLSPVPQPLSSSSLFSNLSGPEIPVIKKKKRKTIPEPTEEEAASLFEALNNCGQKSVILSLVEPYSDQFVPKSLQDKFPPILTELHDERYHDADYEDLLYHCSSLDISFTQEEGKAAEECTRDQAASDTWFRLRAGRITASKMKAVCRTDKQKPSISLIKNICYPEKFKFSTPATAWGCEHEKEALGLFVSKMSEKHQNFKVEDSGIFLNPKFPFLGASPDGVATCDCCGVKLVEIKCPFSKKFQTLDSSDPKFYLNNIDIGGETGLKLDRTHMYYYQVQTQLGVCEKVSSFFVVWTKEDMHVEIIDFDFEMFSEICENAKVIFDKAIMPELVGKFFTQINNVSNKESCLGVLKDHNYL